MIANIYQYIKLPPCYIKSGCQGKPTFIFAQILAAALQEASKGTLKLRMGGWGVTTNPNLFLIEKGKKHLG